MSTPYIDPATVAKAAIDRSNAGYNTTYDQVNNKTQNPQLAQEHAARVQMNINSAGGVFRTVVDVAFTVASDILAEFFNAISAFRSEENHTFDSTIAAVLGEFLMVEFPVSSLAPREHVDPAIDKANAIGTLVLNRLQQEFTAGGAVSMESGEKGAATFLGFGVNFGIQNALISLIGSIVPETRLEDLRELGVEVAQNMGLGRLVRQALRPLVQETITTPYSRKLKRQYQQDLLGLGELARAYLSGRVSKDTAFEFMRQHGLSDEQITELIAQHTPRLKAEEWDILGAIGANRGDINNLADSADGIDAALLANRLRVLQYRRTHAGRERALNAVLTQVSDGFLTPADLNSAMNALGIPADEQQMWALAAGYLFERTRKRLGLGEMLFLYEAAQITLSDVATWSQQQGYSQDDQQRLQLYFELKATEAANKSGSNSAAKVAARHAEHVAYITDEITGMWNRPPSHAELDYWVPLLDVGARTKADVKTELKGLDSSGPAIPA